VERLSSEHAGEVTFAKVDIDQLDAVAADAGISAVPTFHFLNGSKRVSQVFKATTR
jgi:thioredoxin 1